MINLIELIKMLNFSSTEEVLQTEIEQMTNVFLLYIFYSGVDFNIY